MIQKYFKYAEEVEKSTTALKKMRKRIQRKPGVTEEWIKEKAKELWDNEWLDYLDAESFIRSLVEGIQRIA